MVAEFTLAPEEVFLNQPVAVDLTGRDYNRDDGELALYRLEGSDRALIPSQFEDGLAPRLWFLPAETLGPGDEARYVIVKVPGRGTPAVARTAPMTARIGPENISLLAGDREILRYRQALIEAPPGINPLYHREGAYIHPLFAPSGGVLTAIQPDDHYHHYGIWNPWTRTVFEGREVDFWNLGSGQGTVRFAGLLSTVSGELFAGFKVHHEHVDLTAPGIASDSDPESASGTGRTALNEIWDVRSWRVDVAGSPAWLIDFTFTLSCATRSPVELPAYRYGGGIGFRATHEWTNRNSTVLTSEGLTRSEADASFARWCRIEGETAPSGRSGAIFMSHPGNRAHPEPMRVWPEDANGGRGDQFFEFCPIRHEAWFLEPGREYVLRYRVLVYDGEVETGIIETLWRNYAFPVRPVFRNGEREK